MSHYTFHLNLLTTTAKKTAPADYSYIRMRGARCYQKQIIEMLVFFVPALQSVWERSAP